MALKVYQTISDFYEDNQSFLLQQEDRASIMLSNCIRYADKTWEREQPFIAAVKKGKQTELAAMLIPPYALLLLDNGTEARHDVAEELMAYLHQNDYFIHKIMAPVPLGEHFAKGWINTSGTTAKVLMNLRLYTLKKVILPEIKNGEGTFRLANSKDLTFLPGWVSEMTSETSQLLTANDALEHAKMRVDAQTLYLWEVNGTPVSMAAQTRPNIKGTTINLVYTPKKWRGKGYASALVGVLSEHLLHQGFEFCSLFTDLSNPTSNKIYQTIGYEAVCDYVEYKFT